MRLVCMLLVSLCFVCEARGGFPLVEMTVGTASYEGRILAADKFICWIAEANGAYRRISLSNVTAFRDRPGGFKPLGAVQLRDQLRSELEGKLEFEVVGSYVVCAGPGRAKTYGTLLDSTARAFAGYAGRRSLPTQKMEYPLVAIIFPSWDQFRRYAEQDDVRPSPALRGYYNPISNRIALYEGTPPTTAAVPDRQNPVASFAPFDRSTGDSSLRGTLSSLAIEPRADSQETPFAALSGADLKGTLVHEAIHQLAFNTGLHSRFGEEPRWLVEGFAMLLESESHLRDERSANPGDRVDLERYMTFQQGLPKRPKGALTSLVGTDDTFAAAPLDAYAQAWALSFFLTETRSARYADYLKRLARRDRLSAYSTADRVKDFREAFGTDFPMMETQLVRFISDLKVRTRNASR